MLILTRRPSEAVDLTDKRTGEVVATVTVLGLVGGGLVRLGFDAPPHVQILRDNAKATATKREEDNGDEENDDNRGNR